MKNRTVTLSQGAIDLLDELAQAEGVTRREYLHALLHYAGSCHKRPGSWEADRSFDFASYDTRSEDGLYADRWF